MPAAIGQPGVGEYVLAQVRFGKFVCSQEMADSVAVDFFRLLPGRLADWLGGVPERLNNQ